MNVERFELIYEAELFEDENRFELDGKIYSYIYFDRENDCWEWYNWMMANDIPVELHDSYWGITFRDGEWY